MRLNYVEQRLNPVSAGAVYGQRDGGSYVSYSFVTRAPPSCALFPAPAASNKLFAVSGNRRPTWILPPQIISDQLRGKRPPRLEETVSVSSTKAGLRNKSRFSSKAYWGLPHFWRVSCEELLDRGDRPSDLSLERYVHRFTFFRSCRKLGQEQTVGLELHG